LLETLKRARFDCLFKSIIAHMMSSSLAWLGVVLVKLFWTTTVAAWP